VTSIGMACVMRKLHNPVLSHYSMILPPVRRTIWTEGHNVLALQHFGTAAPGDTAVHERQRDNCVCICYHPRIQEMRGHCRTSCLRLFVLGSHIRCNQQPSGALAFCQIIPCRVKHAGP
jgi:hypothetical protein